MKVLDQEKTEQLMRLVNSALSLCDQFTGARFYSNENKPQLEVLSMQRTSGMNVLFSTSNYLFTCGEGFLCISHDIHNGLSWAYGENKKLLNIIGGDIFKIISNVVEKNDVVKYEIKNGHAF